MADYLMRDEAPLTQEEWERLDRTVVEVARRQLVGRRFISLFGPLGAGMQVIASDAYKGIGLGVHDTFGEKDSGIVRAEARQYLTLPLIYKDFRLLWRDIATSRQLNLPLDLAPAAAASAFCTRAEDDLIFHGNTQYGHVGLLHVEGRNTVPWADWDVVGNAFENLVAATQKLVSHDFYVPYAAVVSPSMYGKMYRVYKDTGVLEIAQARELLAGGLYQSPILADGEALVVAVGPENFDLAVAQDLTTAYLGPENMNHPFRVFESLALRIKRPGAICTLEKS